MVFKLQPLQNNLVIKPGGKEEVSKGGVIIPDTAQEKSQEGEVVAIGPGRMTKEGQREVLDVKVGDIVLYPKFSGAEYKIEGEGYIILPELAILAKIAK
ncbi:MAG: co-chaperone GroES [Chloroflexi bacterium]|jgi:chaperonin GroES|nr:co-chaperone GroES [Chloroflexota bacterium]